MVKCSSVTLTLSRGWSMVPLVQNLLSCQSVYQFNHLSDTCDIEQVRGKFMVMKNYCLSHSLPTHSSICCNHTQVSGTVAGPSNCRSLRKSICNEMTYVALSSVKSLTGLHLIDFTPRSITVNVKCLKEINKLRDLYRKDLPLYNLPVSSVATKGQLSTLSEMTKQPQRNHVQQKYMLKKPTEVNSHSHTVFP